MNAQEKALLLTALTEAQNSDKREALDKKIFKQASTGYEPGTIIVFGNEVPVKEGSDKTPDGTPFNFPAVKAIINGKDIADINLNRVIRATQSLNPPYAEHPFLVELSRCTTYQDVANLLANKSIKFEAIVRLEFDKFQAAGTVWRRCTIPEVVPE